mmetsp:Transcript_26198/g.84793  ORF Transcript_26198/g.84793 Transcript_26198/m.84793 type:complete len:201 (+) Transcript_26198:896-1498(+)
MVRDFPRFGDGVVEDFQVEFEVCVDLVPELDDAVFLGAEAQDDEDGEGRQGTESFRDVAVRRLAVRGYQDEGAFAEGPELVLPLAHGGDDLPDALAEGRPAEGRRRRQGLHLPELAVRIPEAHRNHRRHARGFVQQPELRRRVEVGRHRRVERQGVAELVPAARRHHRRLAGLRRRHDPMTVRQLHRPRVVDDEVPHRER